MFDNNNLIEFNRRETEEKWIHCASVICYETCTVQCACSVCSTVWTIACSVNEMFRMQWLTASECMQYTVYAVQPWTNSDVIITSTEGGQGGARMTNLPCVQLLLTLEAQLLKYSSEIDVVVSRGSTKVEQSGGWTWIILWTCMVKLQDSPQPKVQCHHKSFKNNKFHLFWIFFEIILLNSLHTRKIQMGALNTRIANNWWQ